MKQIFEIKDKQNIDKILHKTKFGTLALCSDSVPYSIPVNFVMIDDALYFHSSHKGRKMTAIENNPNVSFSISKEYSMIQSYFSSKDGSACPATHFYQSVVIDGEATIIDNQKEKAKVLEALMQKLQPEGKYTPLSNESYTKALKATAVIKIKIQNITAKCKLGQHLNKERFDMIIEHLEERGNELDFDTIELMKAMK